MRQNNYMKARRVWDLVFQKGITVQAIENERKKNIVYGRWKILKKQFSSFPGRDLKQCAFCLGQRNLLFLLTNLSIFFSQTSVFNG